MNINFYDTGWNPLSGRVSKIIPRPHPVNSSQYHDFINLEKKERKCYRCSKEFERVMMFEGIATSGNRVYLCDPCNRVYGGDILFNRCY